jgi:hypothetical protein
MSALRQLSARRHLALVASALLLPIPLLVVSGLSLPLPSALARGIGSIVPSATGTDEPAVAGAAGVTVGVGAATGELGGSAGVGTAPQVGAAANGRLAIGRRGRTRPNRAGVVNGSGSHDGATSSGGHTSSGEGAATPESPPANPEGGGSKGQGSSAGTAPNGAPGIRLEGAGQGSEAAASASRNGLAVAVGSGGSTDPGASAEVTSTDGSTTRVDSRTPPQTGLPLP